VSYICYNAFVIYTSISSVMNRSEFLLFVILAVAVIVLNILAIVVILTRYY